MIAFHPVTPDRWPDFDRLFSASAGEELGNPSRCWCMEWRLTSRDEWHAGAGGVNRGRMQDLVARGHVPGIIAYVDGEPVGWCSISPRPALIGMREHVRNFNDAGVWVALCFYVPETHRGRGLMPALLEAAVRYAAENGARVVEGYPVEPGAGGDGAGGVTSVFERAGFKRVRELGGGAQLMRYPIAHTPRSA